MVNTLNGNTLPAVGAAIQNPITDRDKTTEVTVPAAVAQQMPFAKVQGPASAAPFFTNPDGAMHSFAWT